MFKMLKQMLENVKTFKLKMFKLKMFKTFKHKNDFFAKKTNCFSKRKTKEFKKMSI